MLVAAIHAQKIEWINNSLLVMMLVKICLENRTKKFLKMHLLSGTKITIFSSEYIIKIILEKTILRWWYCK